MGITSLTVAHTHAYTHRRPTTNFEPSRSINKRRTKPFNMLSTARPKMKAYLLVAASLALLVLSGGLAPVHAASYSSSATSSYSGGTTTQTTCVNGVSTTTTSSDEPAAAVEEEEVDDQDTSGDAVPADDQEEAEEESEEEEDPFQSSFSDLRQRFEERRSRFQNDNRLGDTTQAASEEDATEDGDSVLPDQGDDTTDQLLVDMMMMMPIVDEDNTTAGNTTNTTEPEPVPVPIDVTGAGAALRLHNDYRAMHQVDALSWSSDVEESAKFWANTLAADDCSMYHSSRDQRNGYGENLAIGHSSIGNAVDDWYSEVEDYDFSDPGYSGATGHFTAMVWAGTEELGCAVATCPEGGRTPGRKIYVCQYNPPGNMISSFAENVFPTA